MPIPGPDWFTFRTATSASTLELTGTRIGHLEHQGAAAVFLNKHLSSSTNYMKTLRHLWALENYKINNNNAALQLAVQAAYGPELQNIIIDLQYQQRHALSSPPVGSRRQGLQQHHSLSARCTGLRTDWNHH